MYKTPGDAVHMQILTQMFLSTGPSLSNKDTRYSTGGGWGEDLYLYLLFRQKHVHSAVWQLREKNLSVSLLSPFLGEDTKEE